MDSRQLARIDLNLLVMMEVLLEEGSVSRAAERLFITQSAMSKALGRLRQLFDDPLFTRSGGGLVPTPRAEELRLPLQQVLGDLQKVVELTPFEAAEFVGEFTLVVPDYLGSLLIPPLMARLQQAAPGIRLKAVSDVARPLEQLAGGQVDLIVQLQRQNYPQGFECTPIIEMSPGLLVREDHPLRQQGDALSLKDIGAYPAIRLYMPGMNLEDLAHVQPQLLEWMRHRQPVLETMHLYTALQALRKTNAVLIGPPVAKDSLPMGLVSLPLPVSWPLRSVLVEHRRLSNSRPHQYLKQELLAVMAEL